MERDNIIPELVRGLEPGEWCVMLGGQRLVTFSGPGARDAARKHCEELDVLVGAHKAVGESGDGRIAG
jgi:hypothetical protein